MATSSLLGIDRAPATARGRDAADLGPSDTSDSGSDVAGLGDLDEGDPGLPVDAAADPDSQRSDTVADAFSPGADSDHTGTGERRSAAGDAGRREAADIAPDRIVSDPGGLSDVEGTHEDLLAEGEDGEDAVSLASADAADADGDGTDDAEDDDALADGAGSRPAR